MPSRTAIIGVLLGFAASLTGSQSSRIADAQGGAPITAPRLILAFYYPWYGKPSAKSVSGERLHWEGVDEANQKIANSTNNPQLGPYDSHDPRADRPALCLDQAG